MTNFNCYYFTIYPISFITHYFIMAYINNLLISNLTFQFMK